jgi:hypothetical protein
VIVYAVSLITVENVYSLFQNATIPTVVIIRTFVYLIQNAVFYGVAVLLGCMLSFIKTLSSQYFVSYWDIR